MRAVAGQGSGSGPPAGAALSFDDRAWQAVQRCLSTGADVDIVSAPGLTAVRSGWMARSGQP